MIFRGSVPLVMVRMWRSDGGGVVLERVSYDVVIKLI